MEEYKRDVVSKPLEFRKLGKNTSEYTFDIYIVDMHQVYDEGREDEPLIGVNSVKEMFHSAVGLLSVAFNETEKTIFYEDFFHKSAKTLFCISKDDDCIDYLMNNNCQVPNNDVKENESKERENLVTTLQEALREVNSHDTDYLDLYAEKETPDFDLVFESDVSTGYDSEEEEEEENEEGVDNDNVCDNDGEDEEEYSDSDLSDAAEEVKEDSGNSEDEEESSDDDEGLSSEHSPESEIMDEEKEKEYSRGYQSFLASCFERKLKMIEISCEDRNCIVQEEKNNISSLLGPENRIAAVCNYRIKEMKDNKRIIYISSLVVRRHLRGLGVGTQILDILKSPQIAGHYDYIVVHADLSATNFYVKNGFSGDTDLNRQWSPVFGTYDNCLIMTYVPPFTSNSSDSSCSNALESDDLSVKSSEDDSNLRPA